MAEPPLANIEYSACLLRFEFARGRGDITAMNTDEAAREAAKFSGPAFLPALEIEDMAMRRENLRVSKVFNQWRN